jgi:hypothetical protein
MAQKAYDDLNLNGIEATKVYINSDEFSVWCKIHSEHVNAASRSMYVVDFMTKRELTNKVYDLPESKD